MNSSLPYTISALNQMSQEAFTEALGSIFEHTPKVAFESWRSRPFADVVQLHQTMAAIVNEMSESEQLTLICAHPDLGSKFKMAEASVQEQSILGLDQLSPMEYDRFQALNDAYKKKFGFPFIIAVRNQTKDSILVAFEQRIENTIQIERQQAIAEIVEIARWRLILTIEA
ncbi:MAG: 2-oxo-4-hydroxy-4-carboxy-5-ureidoimidazoline decarboxylase [Pseudanabaena sp. ELA748]